MGLRNVQRGSRGPDVKAVQEGLNKFFGKKLLVEDGIFGNETDKVVRRFQELNDMSPPDGIVGPITRSALFPLVGLTVNLWGIRSTGDRPLAFAGGGRTAANLRLGFAFPGGIPLPIPPGLLNNLLGDELVKPPGADEAVPTPRVTTPPGGRIVVDWQQIMQTQRQFDGVFTNPQDSFAVGFQSVFKRAQLQPNESHLEIATGMLLQSPIGFQDGQGNDFTIAAFAQATWVESLGRDGIFAWAPYAQVQGQGNPTGPPNILGSLSLFPLSLNVDLSKIGLDDVTLQVAGGPIGSLKFTPDGVRATWGSQFGVGLQGKLWVFGR
jgi:hypothetical protein